MKINLKQIGAGIAMVLGLVAAVWGINDQYTPREITEMHIAGLQQGQQRLNLQYQQNDALNWYRYYQYEVERLTRECSRYPNNQSCIQHLNEMKRMRDEAKRRLDALMRGGQ
jgi:hypothetical protein